jgi:GNAT superfamily N-acetyltransferase
VTACLGSPRCLLRSLDEGVEAMGEVMRDLSAPALVRAIEENHSETYRIFRYWPKAEVHDSPELLWILSDIPSAMFNNVFRANLAPDRVDAAIEAVIARCRARNVPVAWHVGPLTKPANLGEALEAHGFSHGWETPCMAADLRALNEDLQVPPGLTIEQVADVETLKQFCHVFAVSFGWPDFVQDAWLDLFASIGHGPRLPVRHYLGRLKGEPVATMSLFLVGGAAGIYCAATLPDARRRGIGAMMTLTLLREARSLGYRVGVLQSSDMGYRVYRRVGFREYCKQGGCVWEPESESGKDTTDAA